MNAQVINETGCCPRFDPVPWDNQIIHWKDKHFIREGVFTFFYMPLNFGKAMKKLDSVAGGAAQPDGLCLADHTSKWNMDLYRAVQHTIPGADNVKMSGKYFCKVYEGAFKDTGKWMSDFDRVVKEKGFSTGKVFMWYTTCPKCAKVYGKNYVVILTEIKE